MLSWFASMHSQDAAAARAASRFVNPAHRRAGRMSTLNERTCPHYAAAHFVLCKHRLASRMDSCRRRSLSKCLGRCPARLARAAPAPGSARAVHRSLSHLLGCTANSRQMRPLCSCPSSACQRTFTCVTTHRFCALTSSCGEYPVDGTADDVAAGRRQCGVLSAELCMEDLTLTKHMILDTALIFRGVFGLGTRHQHVHNTSLHACLCKTSLFGNQRTARLAGAEQRR